MEPVAGGPHIDLRDRVAGRCVLGGPALAPLVVAFMLSNLLDWTWHLPGMTALWAVALGALASSG
ncbi:MAG: hypothetical protein ACRDLT_14945 [Solirubrobacteraceae bacterium]